MKKWSKEQAEAWQNARPWIRGYNGLPSNCVNNTALWQQYKHDEVFEQVNYEFELAKNTGFNSVRTIISFELWLYEHDSFMRHLEEYLAAAEKHGLDVMLCIGNDCNVPKEFYSFSTGPQHVDWGYHSGIKRGQHSGTHTAPGYQLSDEPEMRRKFYDMVDEMAALYARDKRICVWDVWNEIGNSRRGTMSVEKMLTSAEIIRSHDNIAPVTADCWRYNSDCMPYTEEELTALDMSDVITFHCYGSFCNMVRIIENLTRAYDRPLINNEWLNRIEHNNVDDIFPLFYLEKIGSYHWGLIQGYSQTYEPWGCYFSEIADPEYNGDKDFTKFQHDLYRFNGLPYIAKEVQIIKEFSRLADQRFKNEHGVK